MPKKNEKRIKQRIEEAKSGDSNKMLLLAVDYALGKNGMPESLDNAMYWYHRSAELGNYQAMTNIGACYLHGVLDGPDYDLAYDWLIKAARKGSADAEFGLHEMYKFGLGVDKDHEHAYQWLKRARKHSHDKMPVWEKVKSSMREEWAVEVRRKKRETHLGRAEKFSVSDLQREGNISCEAGSELSDTEKLSAQGRAMRQETKENGVIFHKTPSSRGSRSMSRDAETLSHGRQSSKPRKRRHRRKEGSRVRSGDGSRVASSCGKTSRTQKSRKSVQNGISKMSLKSGDLTLERSSAMMPTGKKKSACIESKLAEGDIADV
jgi:hypothetical protein